MTMQSVGYAGLGWATVLAAAATDNIVVVGIGLGVLVALSTLLIRIFLVVDNRIENSLARKMANGDLPTRLERRETQRTLEKLTEKLDELLEERRD